MKTGSILPIRAAIQRNSRSCVLSIQTIRIYSLIEVYGIEDGGNPSKKIISFTLAPLTSKQFNAQDMENGNSSKGLTGHLCDGQGKWQLRIRSDNPIKVMGLIRTPDGFLTSVNDLAGKSGNDNLVYFANPASNPNQQTFLRIVNLTTATGTVTITGVDDAGVTSSGTVMFTLGPEPIETDERPGPRKRQYQQGPDRQPG